MESVKTSSEPGLFVLGNANKRAGRDSITNPCGEILLNEKGGVCNLVELNLLPHVKNGKLDMISVYNALSLITRHSSRITLPNLWHRRWDKVQKEERLLGVSITGLMDTYDKLNWTNKDLSNFYKDVYTFTRDVADLYHTELNIPRSLLVTTTKPTGTISSLQGVSNGIHRHYAPYYIRRVRVSKSDPIAQALIDMNLLVSPENGQGNDINDEKCNTLVFTLVCKSEAKMRAIDESAIEQLERYKLGMQTWCEHNISNTISIDSLYKLKPLESIKLALQNWTKNNNFWNNLNGYSDEWIEVSKWLTENFENFVGVSFIPKFDPEVAIYPQLPFEPINEEKYQDFHPIVFLSL